jgi:hypothetical protein
MFDRSLELHDNGSATCGLDPSARFLGARLIVQVGYHHVCALFGKGLRSSYSSMPESEPFTIVILSFN